MNLNKKIKINFQDKHLIIKAVAGLIFCFFGIYFPSYSQSEITFESEYSNYYMFPIRPGLDNFLAGTLGELRSGHFHGGIDIKTGGVEGLPVYAAADGYISRVNVSSFGYGNALYIKHPNKTTTVYAHLQKFDNEIHHFVKHEQYSRERFDVELHPDSIMFPVKKGQIIALSGNSGSSGGPHLHFEIRDALQKPLNPLKFQFAEIKDNIPPIVENIAIKTMEKDARVNDQFGYFVFPVIKEGNNYIIKEPITISGKVGIEILAFDRLNGSNNKNGVPCIDLYLDNEKIYGQEINTFSFFEGRNILVHSNYQMMQSTGKRYHKLYIDHGNELTFYKNINRGIIQIDDTLNHPVRINLSDPYNNVSSVKLNLKGKSASRNFKARENPAKNSGYTLTDHTLQIFNTVPINQSQLVKIFSNRRAYELKPDYSVNNTDIFLWDLRLGLPDSIDLCGEMIRTNFNIMVPSNTAFHYFHNSANILFPSRSLFDTLYLKMKYNFQEDQEIFEINEDIIPIREYITITLRPGNDYNDQKRTAAYSLNKNGDPSYAGGNWNDDGITFKIRNFGRFTLLTDTIPPSIKVIKASNTECRFQLKDDLSGLKNFKATIDGKWVLMNYDHKRNLIWSEKSDNTMPFKGDFELVVTDNAGNESKFTTKF
ncbi:M23 family metallopeptidase [soil metagenome]